MMNFAGLVRHLSEITPWLDSGVVIQKYIEKPATVQGHKFVRKQSIPARNLTYSETSDRLLVVGSRMYGYGR